MKKYWLPAILTISLILLMSNHVDKNKQVYEESGLFKVDITEKPDTLKTKDLIKYEALVSNWNAFRETSRKWSYVLDRSVWNE